MGDLCLVINLGSSSLKAALVDSTGAFVWNEGQDRTHDLQLQEKLRQALSWWGDFDVIVVPADEAGMIALLCRRHSTANNTTKCTAGSAAIGQVRRLMQQAVQPQAVHIQRVWSQLTGQFAELLFDLLRDANIKHTFHQGLDREQMGVDVLQISNGLLK